MRSFRSLATLLMCVGLMVSAIACQPGRIGEAPAVGGSPGQGAAATATLTVMVNDFGSERMDAAYAGSADGGQNYARLLHGFLIAANEKSELVPGIASKWTLSADGLTWTFTIRKGVKFHDGSDLTTEDVVWSLQHQIGPGAFAWNSATSQMANLSRKVAKVQPAEADQVVVVTTSPDLGLAYFLSEASTLWVPIIPKRAVLNDQAAALAYDKAPIGAGPMKLVQHTPGVSMTFERFDDHYYQPKNGFSEDRRTPFRTLEMRAAKEEATRVSALRAGQADIVTTSIALKTQVEAAGGRLVFAGEALTLEARLIGCFAKPTPCSDKRVRQALDYAIDKTLIQSRLAGGPEAFVVKGWSLVTPSSDGYTTQLDPRPFDAVKARQLMADAGYPGGAGFGKLIVHTFPTEVPFQIDSAQFAADSWKKELGLDVEVRVTDATTVDKLLADGKLNGQIVWRQAKPRADTGNGIVNFFGDPKSSSMLHKDAALTAAVQQAVGILDLAKRTAALKDVYARLWDENYVITSGYLNVAWGVGARITGWKPYSLTRWPSALYTMGVK